ncbi:hypothetical protein WJX72_002362 [[Myrmecia] bisecta]|uniref:60S ribosomal protein L21 n=1 Tax=[Myrmecia] bisecta TaxID=41462 RepID=A0AAW1Q568_9CHLO
MPKASRHRGRGKRNNTRDLFSKGFRQHGYIPESVYLRTYKLGDYVDIKVNSTVHKGMPHKVYQGRTGQVWDVTKRALGVEVNKQVGNRIIRKRLHVRVEHAHPSRCHDDFLKRVKENDEYRHEAKLHGEKPQPRKRQSAQPRSGFMVTDVFGKMETITPRPYDIVKEGLKGA